MLGNGVNFFDEPTAYFAQGQYLLLAIEQFAETNSNAGIAILPRNGGFFARAVDEAENVKFQEFVKKAFEGAVTCHKAHPIG